MSTAFLIKETMKAQSPGRELSLARAPWLERKKDDTKGSFQDGDPILRRPFVAVVQTTESR